MPYSPRGIVPVTSPGGVRVDNGLCLEQIAINWSQSYIRFTLNEDRYFYSGTGADDLFARFTRRVDPGAVWNLELRWGQAKPGLTKQEPPNDPATDIWLIANPPDYIPFAEIPSVA